MRVSDKMIYGQVNDSLNRGRGGLAESLERASSQKRINKPSDDPVATTRALTYKTDEQNIQQYQKILTHAKSHLEYTEQSLGELSEVMVRAKELALAAANDASTNPETRRVLASEINQLKNQIIQIGNRKLAGKFLFGGYKTIQAPFTSDGEYRGDDGEIKVPVDKESFVAINMPGSRIFLGKPVGSLLDNKSTPQDSSEAPNTEDPNIEPNAATNEEGPVIRGPASVKEDQKQISSPSPKDQFSSENNHGLNLFNLMKRLEIAFITGDKFTVQTAIDDLDQAHAQTVLSRAELGSRLTNLNSSIESLAKSKVDTKAAISELEDEDMFKAVSDVNRNEATLKASLSTSAKLMQPSLLDFLR